jgi:hypothetical protein
MSNTQRIACRATFGGLGRMAAVVALVVHAGLAGCGMGSDTPLPSLGNDAQKVLTKEERERAIRELSMPKESASSGQR